MSIEKRERMRELGRRGGIASGKVRCKRIPTWRRAFVATLGAMGRWHPDSPMLSMPKLERDALARAIWEAGFKAGAGWKGG